MLSFIKKNIMGKNTPLHTRIDALENERASIAAPMFTVDKDLLITFINDSALKVMGYTRKRSSRFEFFCVECLGNFG